MHYLCWISLNCNAINSSSCFCSSTSCGVWPFKLNSNPGSLTESKSVACYFQFWMLHNSTFFVVVVFTPANISGYIKRHIGSHLYGSSHAFFSARLHPWHLVRCLLTFSDVTNLLITVCSWIKNPIDVLSAERVLQEITYKTVSQEAAGVENERWLTCASGLISFPTIWRVLIKSTSGSPIMNTPGACHRAMSSLCMIFSMHERFYLISPFNSTLMITQYP